jgi:ABC-type transport system substrate-binding protein
MNISRRAFMVLVVVTGLIYSGCKKPTPEEGHELSFAIENELTNLDPIKSQEPYSLQVIGQIFEGLVSLDSQNQMVPVLAESWSNNKDYTVWQFKIRKSVCFHEDDCLGAQKTREVTAQDVLYSFQRIVSKATQGRVRPSSSGYRGRSMTPAGSFLESRSAHARIDGCGFR